jgi:Zn ribbon nucleic-acid-binding protein
MIECRVCYKKSTRKLFSTKLLRQNVDYFECLQCGYVQTVNPTWLEEAYASTMHTHDTGIMMRNSSNTSLVLATLIVMGSRKKNSLTMLEVMDY